MRVFMGDNNSSYNAVIDLCVAATVQQSGEELFFSGLGIFFFKQWYGESRTVTQV